jgi:hypothetical protein
MSEALTDVDVLLLDRWADATALRDAIKELEDRLGDRFEATGDRLRAWVRSRGFEVIAIDKRTAWIAVAKPAWMTKANDELVSVSVGAVLPYGYRRVQDEHPYVWVGVGHLNEDEQQAFNNALAGRLKGLPDAWLNDECTEDFPAGLMLSSVADPERVKLAQSEEDLEAFIKTALEKAMSIEVHIDAALAAARPSKVGARIR